LAEKLRKKFLPFSRKKQPKGKWLLDVVPESFPQKREQLVPTINIGVPGEAELLRSGAFRAALHDEFADAAGITLSQVQKLEYGEIQLANVTFSTAVKIANAFGISADQLWTRGEK
jgi:transcriptional regulator with XRE-family HTH domain